MYEEFLGLKGRPFLAAARVDRYYPAASIEQARQQLARSIERADGFGVVVGPSGIGKSLLCQVLAEQFRSQFKVAHLATGRLCSPRAMMQAILYELNLPYRDMSEGELRLSLVDHLEPSADCPNGMLLIVDEAHSLPVRLFEEMRMLTNQVRDGMPRVRLVLAGNNRLEERLNEPRLDSFSQRVIARCYLESLNRDETTQYVRAQFAAVGGDPDQVFDESAIVSIQRATEGIPRLVNQLCDHALILACTAGVKNLDAQRIEEAWADLQQLPPPWSEVAPVGAANETTIEFGSLDELSA
ncbi:MAG: AAA family ATPase, partial [Pirellulales bacterium]|nr:AAA family ATPase [Pirellulales bacterium]